jgi:uncharacterized DUF497 family protein
MRIEYDASKSRRNIEQRGISFDSATELLDSDPLVIEDRRRDYRERRFIAYGWLGDRLHVCVYTLRGDTYRIISLRRANRREIIAYRAEVVRRSEEIGLRDQLGTDRRDDR